MISQDKEIAPPLPGDEGLRDFAAVVQDNMQTIFQALHTHGIRTTAPSASEGNVGDIVIATISGTSYLYAKVSSTSWLRVALS